MGGAREALGADTGACDDHVREELAEGGKSKF